MYTIIRDARSGVVFACKDCEHKIYTKDFPMGALGGSPRTRAASAMWEHMGEIHGASALVAGAARPLAF
jgi:hypothetical protein